MLLAKEKVTEWLENNPDGWLTKSFSSIGKEIGVSAASVDRYLPELVADRDNILPSEVMQKRQESGYTYQRKPKIDIEKVREIIKNNPDAPIRDLVYLAKCSTRVIKRVQKEIEEENQSANSDNEVNDNEAEIEQLKARIAKLSNS